MTILCSIVLKNKNYKNVARKLERRNIVTYIQRKKKKQCKKILFTARDNAIFIHKMQIYRLFFSDKIGNYPKNLIFIFLFLFLFCRITKIIKEKFDYNFVLVNLLS